MTGYPWSALSNKTLFADDLNAAFSVAYANAAAANAAALQAQATANAALTTATSAQTLATTTAGQIGPLAITVSWPGLAVSAATYVLCGTAPYSFTITSLDIALGASGGSVSLTVHNDGIAVSGLSGLASSASNKTRYPATGNNLVAPGAIVDIAIVVTAGSPTDSYITLNGTRS